MLFYLCIWPVQVSICLPVALLFDWWQHRQDRKRGDSCRKCPMVFDITLPSRLDNRVICLTPWLTSVRHLSLRVEPKLLHITEERQTEGEKDSIMKIMQESLYKDVMKMVYLSISPSLLMQHLPCNTVQCYDYQIKVLCLWFNTEHLMITSYHIITLNIKMLHSIIWVCARTCVFTNHSPNQHVQCWLKNIDWSPPAWFCTRLESDLQTKQTHSYHADSTVKCILLSLKLWNKNSVFLKLQDINTYSTNPSTYATVTICRVASTLFYYHYLEIWDTFTSNTFYTDILLRIDKSENYWVNDSYIVCA